ncbi:MAG: hypothetical protein JNM56_29285 [Planctomycetia bacterium]|nr:hypothetical protein [Planctomycetia bacterium]
MIQPDDIRRKAENLYGSFLQAWLRGDDTFFPRTIPANKVPDAADVAAAISSVRRLRDGAKEVLGYGYTVEWREVNSRKLGRNQFPSRIFFDNQADYLTYLAKERAFASFTEVVTQLRAAFPVLEGWIRANAPSVVAVAPELEGLVQVVEYFRDHPRPDRFARELPIPVDTKFIERHEGLLREWLDLVLPPHTIRADEDHFERRFGLRYAEPHLHVRVLDPFLQQELGLPWLEFSLPLHALAELPVREASAVIVENKVNLLTLPALQRTIGLGGLGRGVTILRYVPWLKQLPLVYWGDIDVEGFEILSTLRAVFPQTCSVLMDLATLDRWCHLASPGKGRTPDVPVHLSDQERAAFLCCRERNLRLEQERLPVPDTGWGLPATAGDRTDNTELQGLGAK